VALAVHQGMLDVSVTDDMFVTAFYGVLHRPSGKLMYVRAAQERPLLYRPDSGLQELPANGRFLGMFDELDLIEETVVLQPGDRLIVFSDGVPDMVDVNEEPYGYKRLHEVILANGRLSAKELVAAILADLDAFSQHADPFDDVTILIAEMCG
jgi:sigma-B regulation protein RsbU (phosphoserine phosphatase)